MVWYATAKEHVLVLPLENANALVRPSMIILPTFGRDVVVNTMLFLRVFNLVRVSFAVAI
jgi:hypothetical protein